MAEIKDGSLLARLAGRKLLWLTGLFAALVVLPAVLSQSWVSIATEMIIMSLSACALNIMLGYTGMVSFGPAGLYAVGAYTTGIFMAKLHLDLVLAMLSAPVMAALIGLVVGWICVRRSAVYFALLTLAFAQIIWTVIFEWYAVTGGDDGLVSIPIPDFFFKINNSYYFCLVVVAGCLFVVWRIIKSPFGQTLQAIRENPGRVESIGVNVRRYQLAAFVLSSLFLGIAGSLFCVFSGSVFPNYAHWIKSTDMLVICLLGGIYNFVGPMVGSVIYILLSKMIAKYTTHWHLVLGVIIVLIVMFMRNGVVGFLVDRFSRWRRSPSAGGG